MEGLKQIDLKLKNNEIYIVSGNNHSVIYDLRYKFAKVHQLTGLDRTTLEKLRNKIDGSLNINDIVQFNNNLFSTEKLEHLLFYDIINKKSLPQISSLWLETNLNCNFNCKYCYTENKCGKLSNDNVDTFLSLLKENDFKQISIIGGEPFLEDKLLINVVEKIRKIFSKKLLIYTNGSLIKPEHVDFLKHCDIQLSISTYAIDENICTKITSASDVLKKQLKTIELCKNNNIDFQISFVMNALNSFYSPEDFIDFFKINPNQLIASSVCLMKNSKNNLIDETTLNFKYITSDMLNSPILSESIKNKMSFHHCFGESMYISHDLTAYPCSMDHSIKYGNLQKETFQSILKNAEPIRRFGKEMQPICKNCEYRYICKDCTADYGVSNYKSSKPICKYNQSEGFWEE